MEKIPNENNQREDQAFFTRHSKSTYKTYGKMVSSENPTQAFNPENQETPDLPESGIELAKEKAESFFETLNPEKDVLFFASSNEARALETANIYREVAKEKGFEIVKPEHSRSELSTELSDGDIRVVRSLSIYPYGETNAVIDSVFNPPSKRGDINWEKIDPELKERFDKASKIIEADDKGSFGPNFAVHSEKIKKIFPEINTAEQLFESKFKNIMKLIKFGLQKAKESGLERNVKILGFGHENYMMHALEKYFKEDGIGNCETVTFDIEDNIRAQFRDKEAEIN